MEKTCQENSVEREAMEDYKVKFIESGQGIYALGGQSEMSR